MTFVVAQQSLLKMQVQVIRDDPDRPGKPTLILPNGTRMAPPDCAITFLRIVAAPQDLATELADCGFEVAPAAPEAYRALAESMDDRCPELRQDPPKFKAYKAELAASTSLTDMTLVLHRAAIDYGVTTPVDLQPWTWEACAARYGDTFPDLARLLNCATLRRMFLGAMAPPE